ncbi:hypothetical protein [Streptomyces sp. NPDC089799]|uniref:hypothetical protein n=1 Tax=Streptomyces sp. NPDC089799 TaxID=3155066 RepID=UPI0034392575
MADVAVTGGVGRGLAGAALVAMAVLGSAGCSGTQESASDAASKAASAAQSAGAEVSAAASKAAGAASSAAGVAENKLDEIKNGVEAKDEVALGEPSADSEGYVKVPVTVQNTDAAKKSFAVQVNFKDESGNKVDTVIVTIDDVAGKATGRGTARSTHRLPGSVTAETERAVRY